MADDDPSGVTAAQQRLDQALTEASRKMRAGGADGAREAIIEGIAAAVDFVAAVAPSSAKNLDRIWMVAVAALRDLQDGVVSALFIPKNIGPGVRLGFRHRELEIRSAATLQSLCDIGIHEQVANKLVTGALNSQCGFSFSSSGRAVQNWRSKWRNTQTFKLIYAAETNAMVVNMAGQRRTVREIRDALLDNLVEQVRWWYPETAPRATSDELRTSSRTGTKHKPARRPLV